MKMNEVSEKDRETLEKIQSYHKKFVAPEVDINKLPPELKKMTGENVQEEWPKYLEWFLTEHAGKILKKYPFWKNESVIQAWASYLQTVKKLPGNYWNKIANGETSQTVSVDNMSIPEDTTELVEHIVDETSSWDKVKSLMDKYKD